MVVDSAPNFQRKVIFESFFFFLHHYSERKILKKTVIISAVMKIARGIKNVLQLQCN